MSASEFQVQPARPKPVYQIVVDQLKRAIQLGNYLPGEQLPSERELAEQMEVSRTTIRGASRALEGEGLIKTRRGRYGGMFVLQRQLSAVESRRLLQANWKAIEGVLEFRQVVEPATARLAAERRTKADLKRLEALFGTLVEVAEIDKREPGGVAPYLWGAADINFHLAIAGLARNDLLGAAVADARAAISEQMGIVVYPIPAEVNDLHEEILMAIGAQDGDAANDAMARHIELVRHGLDSYRRFGSL